MTDIFVILLLLSTGLLVGVTLLERRIRELQVSIDQIGEAAGRVALARQAAAAEADPPTDPGRAPMQTDAG